MNGEELHKEIRQRVAEAGRKKIWGRASLIAETFGKRQVHESSAWTTVRHEFFIKLGREILGVIKSNYAMGGDYILIDANGRRVFEADLKNRIDVKPEDRPMAASLSKDGDRIILIKLYIPGNWEMALNFDLIKKTLEAEEKEKKRLRREKAQNQPLTAQEKELAKKFGIRTD